MLQRSSRVFAGPSGARKVAQGWSGSGNNGLLHLGYTRVLRASSTTSGSEICGHDEPQSLEKDVNTHNTRDGESVASQLNDAPNARKAAIENLLQLRRVLPRRISNLSGKPVRSTTGSLHDWVAHVIVASSRGVASRSHVHTPQITLEASDVVEKRICIRVVINRPGSANALNSRLLEDLTRLFRDIANIDTLQGVMLTAVDAVDSKPRFCSGADRNELAQFQGRKDAELFIRRISSLCGAIRSLPVPVVALINGPCIGAGLEVAASCDIRVATRNARFSMPEVLLGIPSVVEARLLCDIVGWGRARHLMLTGCTWNAEEAYVAGLITNLFNDKKAMMDWADKYASQLNNDTSVYRDQKRLMKDWENMTIDQGVEAGVNCFVDAFTDDRFIQPPLLTRLKRKEPAGNTDGSEGDER